MGGGAVCIDALEGLRPQGVQNASDRGVVRMGDTEQPRRTRAPSSPSDLPLPSHLILLLRPNGPTAPPASLCPVRSPPDTHDTDSNVGCACS